MDNFKNQKCIFCDSDMDYQEVEIIHEGKQITEKSMKCNNENCNIKPTCLSEETSDLMDRIWADNIGCTVEELRKALEEA